MCNIDEDNSDPDVDKTSDAEPFRFMSYARGILQFHIFSIILCKNTIYFTLSMYAYKL